MTVQSYKLGPGTLTLGSAPLDVSAQVTAMKVEWSENVTSGEDLDLLSGDSLLGDQDATYRANLAGNLLQDIAAAGVVDWSWTNKGTEQAFKFVPSTSEGRQITGVLVPVPITVGGDVKTRPRSDITWRIVGDPDLAALVA
jgi:hypothetical protein